MEVVRRVKVFRSYYKEFYVAQTDAVREKIDQVIELVKYSEIIPAVYLRKIINVPGLYEIRVRYAGNIYRIFCCFDEGCFVILFHGFHKQSQKTPSSEIKKAKRIMKEYFDTKR